jgi:tRNA A37 N6-isopentenylltransferase MiaA
MSIDIFFSCSDEEMQTNMAYMLLNSVNILHVAGQNWGRVDNFRYNCCFICVDSSLPVLDRHVEQRVDCMIEAGLLNEVVDIYRPNADYTRGLRQAIGVREFEIFLRDCTFEVKGDEESDSTDWSSLSVKSINEGNRMSMENIGVILDLFNDKQPKILLKEAIEKMKLNTRRLVRRQVSIVYNCFVNFLDMYSYEITVFFPNRFAVAKFPNRFTVPMKISHVIFVSHIDHEVFTFIVVKSLIID